MAAKGKGGRVRSNKMTSVFYVALVAIIISIVGVVYSILVFVASTGVDTFTPMGLSTAYYTPDMLVGMGIVMLLQSVAGLLTGVTGIRASNTAFPGDGKPFMACAVVALLLSAGGLLRYGSTSFVALLVDAICIYEAWVVLHLPDKRSKSKKNKKNK
ncbi:MAG: hypothetical protein ACOX12_04635 [Eggerthellaceae bacterium]|jgi:hypothetical protein